MSTHLYLRCVTHDPYIQSDSVGAHLGHLPRVRQAWMNRDALNENMQVLLDDPDALWPEFSTSYENALRWFLYQHPHCDLELWDEYGQHYPWVEGPVEKPITWSSPLGEIETIVEERDGIKVKFFKLTPEGERLMKRIQNNDIQPMSFYGKDLP